MSKIAECVLCNKPDYLKRICKYRDWPFNEPKIKYLDINARCSKRSRPSIDDIIKERRKND